MIDRAIHLQELNMIDRAIHLQELHMIDRAIHLQELHMIDRAGRRIGITNSSLLTERLQLCSFVA